MLKLAVIGAASLLGRELVQALETRECSVLPLTAGPMTRDEEVGDLVVFAPDPALLEEIDLVILVETPVAPGLLAAFKGRILDLRAEPDPALEPMPLAGAWPAGVSALRGRPPLEQVLATVPHLVGGVGEAAGTHLQSVAHLGDRGVDGLMEQTVAIFRGEDPEIGKLGYRAAFEVVPEPPRGRLVTVRVPAFHGDLLILHLRAEDGRILARLMPPQGVEWRDRPASSREVAVSPYLLAHFAPAEGDRAGVLTLGFDPILWGVLMPTMRLLEL